MMLQDRLRALVAAWLDKRTEQLRQANDWDAKHDQAGNAHACLARARIYQECLADLEAARAAAPKGPPT